MGVTRKFEQLALPVSPLWGMNMCPGLTVNIYLFPLPCLLQPKQILGTWLQGLLCYVGAVSRYPKQFQVISPRRGSQPWPPKITR